jgi:hypothetical protein
LLSREEQLRHRRRQPEGKVDEHPGMEGDPHYEKADAEPGEADPAREFRSQTICYSPAKQDADNRPAPVE